MEFTVLTTFMLFIFATSFIVVQDKMTDIQDTKTDQRAEQLSNLIKSQVEIADRMYTGYQTKFTLPDHINGEDYEITIYNHTEIVVEYAGRKHIAFLQEPIYGDFFPGHNMLGKFIDENNETTVYINTDARIPACEITEVQKVSGIEYQTWINDSKSFYYNNQYSGEFDVVTNITFAPDITEPNIRKVTYPETVSEGGIVTETSMWPYYSYRYSWAYGEDFSGPVTVTVEAGTGKTATCQFTIKEDVTPPPIFNISILDYNLHYPRYDASEIPSENLYPGFTVVESPSDPYNNLQEVPILTTQDYLTIRYDFGKDYINLNDLDIFELNNTYDLTTELGITDLSTSNLESLDLYDYHPTPEQYSKFTNDMIETGTDNSTGKIRRKEFYFDGTDCTCFYSSGFEDLAAENQDCNYRNNWHPVTSADTDGTYQDAGLMPGNCFRYQYLIKDNVSNANTLELKNFSVRIEEEPKCFVNFIEGDQPEYQHASSDDVISSINYQDFLGNSYSRELNNTLYYNPDLSGTATFEMEVSDITRGAYINEVTFPDTFSSGRIIEIIPEGFSQEFQNREVSDIRSTISHSYTFDNTANSNIENTVSVNSNSPNNPSGSCPFKITADTNSPTGGYISYPNSYIGNLPDSTTVSVSFDPGTDSDSGLDSNFGVIQKSTGDLLTNGNCDNWGSWTTIAENVMPGSYDIPINDVDFPPMTCHKFKYTIRDNVNNQKTYDSSNILKREGAPTCTISNIIPLNNYGYFDGINFFYNNHASGDFEVEVTPEYIPESGIEYVEFPTTTSEGGKDSTSLYTNNYHWSETSSYEGTGTANVVSGAGEKGECDFSVVIDNSNPFIAAPDITGNIYNHNGDIYFKGEIILESMADDDTEGSGIDINSCQADIGSGWTEAYYDGGMCLFSATPTTDITAIMRVSDKVENTATSYERNYYYDGSSPTISSESVDPSSLVPGGTTTITADVTDQGSGMDYCKAELYDGAEHIESLGNLGSDCDGDVTIPSDILDGNYLIKLRAYDNLGNNKLSSGSAITISSTVIEK